MDAAIPATTVNVCPVPTVGFDLAWIRGFEGTLPGIPNASYAPFKTTTFPRAAFNNSGTTVIQAQFMADYTQPANVINDLSDGLSGVRHPGIRAIGANLGGFQGSYPTVFYSTPEVDLPQWVSSEITAPISNTSPTIPPTAKIFDDFSDRDSSPFWVTSMPDVSMGSTQGGTLGVLPWTTGTAMYGISSGTVYPVTTSTSEVAVVDTSTQTQDIRINREGKRMSIMARYADSSNYIQALFYDNGGPSALQLDKTVAGVTTTLFSGNVGSFESDIRITVSGTTITVYMGGVQVTQQTSSPLPTGTKAGFQLSTPYRAKVTQFEVY